ncbi:hypothetical protein C7M79_05045 [Clostridium botulinum]|nr:hypothetical protein C7M79_05045 [Clostridium botulinum]
MYFSYPTGNYLLRVILASLGLKIGICGVKGIRTRLEILSCFCKIYICSKLLFERSASYNLEPYILRKNKLESLIEVSCLSNHICHF